MGTGYCAPFHHGKRRLAGWVPAESAGVGHGHDGKHLSQGFAGRTGI